MDPIGGLIGLGILLTVGLFLVIFGDSRAPQKATRKK